MFTSAMLFVWAVSASLILTWLVRNKAVERGWVAPPTSGRHIHVRAVPRLGGVAIYIAFVSALAMSVGVFAALGRHWPLDRASVLALVGTATLIFLLGLYDDICGAKPLIKFSVQIACGLALASFGYRIVVLPRLLGSVELGVAASLALTVFWVVWITNAFNLIDGMDGLAAGSALLSTFVVLLVAVIRGDLFTMAITAALAGGILGFLRFNFNPATIFLGDSGSLLIGFILSALALKTAGKSTTLIAVALPLVAFGLPIMDTTLAIVRRFMSGKPIFSADRDHIHHKLLARGLSHKQAVLVLYGISAVFGMFSLALLQSNARGVTFILLVLSAALILGVQKLGYVEFGEFMRLAQRTFEQKQVIANNIAIRRAAGRLPNVASAGEISETLHEAFAENDFDGFGVELTLANARPLHSSFTHSWRKPEFAPEAAWTLTLPLVVDGREVGSWTVERDLARGPLMADMNLLTGMLHDAMLDAVARLNAPALELMPKRSREAASSS